MRNTTIILYALSLYSFVCCSSESSSTATNSREEYSENITLYPVFSLKIYERMYQKDKKIRHDCYNQISFRHYHQLYQIAHGKKPIKKIATILKNRAENLKAILYQELKKENDRFLECDTRAAWLPNKKRARTLRSILQFICHE